MVAEKSFNWVHLYSVIFCSRCPEKVFRPVEHIYVRKGDTAGILSESLQRNPS